MEFIHKIRIRIGKHKINIMPWTIILDMVLILKTIYKKECR